MNPNLKAIQDFLNQNNRLTDTDKQALLKAVDEADKQWSITEFKLDRTEKVKKTTAILLEETIEELEQKRKAVEAQNRELEIEAALERVRAVALSMKAPADMLEICSTIALELDKLGVKEIRNVQTAIFYEDKGTYMNYEYYAKHNKTFITETLFTNHKMHREFAAQMLKGKGEFFSTYMSKSELPDWIAYQKTTNVFIDSYLETASSLSYYWHSLGAVALGISTYEPLKEEEINLFRRFLKVFELSYTRYLDIEQAIAQAREAQIQLALERVRARTMAMQKSDELSETVYVLFQQFKELGENPDQATIGVINEDEKVIEYWVTMYGQPINKVFKFSIDEPNVTNKIYTAWKENKKSLVIDLSGDALAAFMAYRAAKGGAAINADEKRRIINVAFFSKGLLNVQSNKERSEESIKLLERFAFVFEQTYTRFLDLQKAEAQAREAQIEAALEKIRSRSLGMHHSDELAEVVTVVFEKLQELEFVPVATATIILFNAGSRDSVNWIARTGLSPALINYPYFETSITLDFWKAKEGGMDFFQKAYSYEEKNIFLSDLFERTALKDLLSDELKTEALEKENYACAYAFSTNSGIYIDNLTGKLLSEKEIEILKRFARVFEQAYIRFLDLQKAEAQTREAHIEAALERVRSKAMSMHNSEHLTETITVFYREIESLSVTPRRCGIGLLNKESRIADISTMNTIKEGNPIEVIGKIKLDGNPVLEGIYDNWLIQKEYHPVLRGNEIKQYYALVMPQISYPDYPNDVTQYGYFFYFPEGGVFAWTEKQLSEDELQIYRRFTSVLNLTYKRYGELQKAEANAREAIKQAALDRIRADIASMRTIGDLERITPLIWNELTILGIPFIRCGVFIMDDEQQFIHTFLSTPEGKAIAAFHIPYNTPGRFSDIIHHWHQKQNYISYWHKNEFESLADSLVHQGTVTTRAQYLNTLPEEGIYLHFLPFLQGMLYVGNTASLNEEEIKLIQSVADAFSTAYARYEDFNKLEAAKEQIEKTLVDLKQAQQQLVQSEKMASLGELTAGIAHEIQNPLNFVNNFSEVNKEMLEEATDEINKGNFEEVKVLLSDIKENEEKINHHGKRADAIVKGMLQHSRKSEGKKEPTDINALCDEYLRLSFHGLRAKDKSFNADFKTDFDETIGKINIVPQDIGRVLLNLINNAFYAVSAPSNSIKREQYKPLVSVTTRKLNSPSRIEISVKDNGSGIPQNIVDKIFQPFFTTKPTGQGTGLGLSLSYDIIKAHGGEIKVETKEGEQTIFIIQLPTS